MPLRDYMRKVMPAQQGKEKGEEHSKADFAKKTKRSSMKACMNSENDVPGVNFGGKKPGKRLSVRLPPKTFQSTDEDDNVKRRRTVGSEINPNELPRNDAKLQKIKSSRGQLQRVDSIFGPQTQIPKPIKEEPPIQRAKSRRTTKVRPKPEELIPHGALRLPRPKKAEKPPQFFADTNLNLDSLRCAIDLELESLPRDVEDVDKAQDAKYTPQFSRDVITYLKEDEKQFHIPVNFLDSAVEVNPHMRAILTDWMIQVQHHLSMLPDTLHMAVSLVDLFLVSNTIALKQLQLLGITSLLVAAKFEERFPPRVGKLIHLTDDTYKYNDVICMERHILRRLGFRVHVPLATVFLDRFIQCSESLDRLPELSSYLLDLSVTDLQSASFFPSLRAASAVYMARKVIMEYKALQRGDEDVKLHIEMANQGVYVPVDIRYWTSTLAYYTGYSESDLVESVHRLAKILVKTENSTFQGAKNKYKSQTHFRGISLWRGLMESPAVHSEAFRKPGSLSSLI